MSNYVDVVTVSTAMYGKKLRIAPAFSNLKVGDRVKIEVPFNPFEIEGSVYDIAAFNTDREEFRLLRGFVGVNEQDKFELDMKVTKKLLIEPIEWGDEDKEGSDANG